MGQDNREACPENTEEVWNKVTPAATFSIKAASKGQCLINNLENVMRELVVEILKRVGAFLVVALVLSSFVLFS